MLHQAKPLERPEHICQTSSSNQSVSWNRSLPAPRTQLGLQQPVRQHSWRAAPMMSASKGTGEGRNFNPFRDRKKEDAAKKALQEMFQGKQDLLAAYDAGGGGSGKGAKGKGGGGGDEGEGAFDWRAFVQSLIRGTGKTARSVGQATGALLLLLAIFYGASLVKPAAAAGLAAVRWLLRLDGRGSRRARQPTPVLAAPAEESTGGLGANESSVIAKYGAADEDDDEEE